MMIFISIILILSYQLIIVHGEEDGSESTDEDGPTGLMNPLPPPPPAASPFNDANEIPEEFANALNDYCPGKTFQYADLSNIVTDMKIYDDQCEFQLRPDVDNFMGDKLIIGQLARVDQIIYVQLSFHNEDGDILQDDFGNLILYKSSRIDLGHILDIFHQGFLFSYAKCLLKLKPKANFNPKSLVFHFANHSSSRQNNNKSGIITGPTFPISSIGQMYNVSVNCSRRFTCMWLLDNTVISTSPNTSILLTFNRNNIGNHTLSYVAYFRNKPQILASLKLSILPSSTQVCNSLQNSTNIWLLAGNMSSPRVYFTVTYLLQSGYVMIAGGTADNFTGLLSVDIYNPVSGCYNTSNMTDPRMKHTAAYYNDSDVVILIGGVRRGTYLFRETELISLNVAQLYQTMAQTRYLHEIAILNGSNILIVAGLGWKNSGQLEIYNRSSSEFQLMETFYPELNDLVGHSVTTLGDTGFALIFGGYNGSAYSRAGFITDGTNLTLVGEEDDNMELISARARHQATYIPNINAVLITGGDNGTNTFSTCYLYDVETNTFNTTGPMNQQRSFHAAVLLSNGSVLIIGGAGGISGNQPSNVLRSVERYDYTTNTFTIVASLNAARCEHKAVSVPPNEVFVFGGISSSGNILSSFEYIKFNLQA